MLEKIQETASWLKTRMKTNPKIAIILGTGLGQLASEITDSYEFPYTDIPNFPVSTVQGHAGKLIFGKLGGKDIMAMDGRFHYYEGYTMQEVTFPERVMHELGIQTLFVSNASGGMNPNFKVGDIMIITDHINYFPEHPLRGKNIPYGPRFPDMSEAYCKELISKADEIAKEKGGGYMEGVNDTINSVVAMIPAENPEFIMYVTVQQPQHWSILYWQDLVTPVLKKAMSLKDSLNLTGSAPALANLANETEYKLPDIIGESPGDMADELRRNLVQPVILGNGSKIEKVSKKAGTNLAANQQILLLTNRFETLPDMYGWTKANVEKFSSWTDIEINFEGSGSKVVSQSIDVGASLEKTNKITITLGD